MKKKKAVLHKTDKTIIESCKSGKGLISIKSTDALMELANMAKETHEIFIDSIRKIMDKKAAKHIKMLRCEYGYSWRMVASASYKYFSEKADWAPESNQLAGMALCEIAAESFNEDYMPETWN